MSEERLRKKAKCSTCGRFQKPECINRLYFMCVYSDYGAGWVDGWIPKKPFDFATGDSAYDAETRKQQEEAEKE